MKKRILITGATGFLGYHLIEEAYKHHYEVYAGIRKGSNVKHLNLFDIKYVPLSYHSKNDLNRELESIRVNYIIHAAGTTKAKNEKAYNLINATYSLNLAHASSQANIDLKKFVLISSLAAVGPGKNNEPIVEALNPSPVSSYGKSKLLAENLLNDIEDFPLIIFRPTAIYGPRERDLFTMVKSILNGIEPYIGNKEQKLSFVYAKDVAEIAVSSLITEVFRETYHISDGNAYTRYQLAEVIKTIAGSKTLKLHLPSTVAKIIASTLDLAYRFSNKTPLLNRDKLTELTASNWSCSIEKIKKDLGFNPKYNLEKGLDETIKWYKNNNWL